MNVERLRHAYRFERRIMATTGIIGWRFLSRSGRLYIMRFFLKDRSFRLARRHHGYGAANEYRDVRMPARLLSLLHSMLPPEELAWAISLSLTR